MSLPEVMAPADILLGARELIAGGWCQRATARDAQGNYVDEIYGPATSFCLTGALNRASFGPKGILLPPERAPSLQGAVDLLRLELGEAIASWNDTSGRTQMEAVLALERTAAKAMGLLQ